jgi:3-oxoadipate enol-lactonase
LQRYVQLDTGEASNNSAQGEISMEKARLPDGAELAYDVYDFAPPWKQVETVILVHGFSKNRKFWYSWIPELGKRYRVIRVDQRGHNDSSPIAPGFEMSLRPFSQDLANFTKVIGIHKAHFVMAEFASVVAVDFATTFPHLLESLTLPGFAYNFTNLAISPAESVRIAEEEERVSEHEGALATWSKTIHLRLPADIDPQLREWYINEQSRMPGWLRLGLRRYTATLDLTDLLPKIKIPTLIIAGSAAQQGPIENNRKAEKLIPDCRLVVLEGMPFNVMTASPEPCVAATIKFLDEVTRRKG